MPPERGRAGALVLLLAAGAGLFFLSVPSPKLPDRDITRLTLPATLDHRLNGDAVHAWRFHLQSGEALTATLVDSRDDVVLRLLDPSETELFRVDSENGLRDSESLHVFAESAGDYVLEIRSGADAGRLSHYRLEVGPPHPATDEDRIRAAAMSRFSQGERLFHEEAWKLAAARYFEALDLWEASRDAERASATRFRLGRALQGLMKWGPAELVLDDALKEVRARRSPISEACLLDRVGRGRLQSGDLDKARDLFRQALQIFRQERFRPGEADILGNLGVAARYQGDFQGGVKLDLESLELWKSLGGLEEQSTLYQNLGELYLIYGQPEQARDAFDNALTAGTKAGSLEDQALALRGKGTACGQLGQVDKALSFLRSSIDLWRERGDTPGEVISLVRLGDVFNQADRLTESRLLYERALRLSQESGFVLGQAMAMGNLGHVLEQQGKDQEGLRYFEKAEAAFIGIGDTTPLPKLSFGKAEAYLDLGDLEKARSAVEEAIGRFESFQSPYQRVAASSDRRASYEMYVDVLMRLQAPDLAFEAAETSRFRTLLDDIGKSRAGTRRSDPAILKLELELESRLNVLELERWRLPEGSKRIEEIDREVRDLDTRLALARRDLYSRSESTLPKPLTLEEVQRSLDQDSLLLVYFLGENRSLLWEIGREQFQTHELPGRSEIEAAARRVHEELSEANTQQWRGWTKALKTMSRLALEKVAERLQGRKLIIDPDGALNVVPFAALLDPRTLERSGRPGDGSEGPRFLVFDHEIVTVPSVSLIAARRGALAKRSPAPGSVAILADPVFDGRDPRVPVSLRGRIPVSEFPRLQQTAWEADAILATVRPGERSFVARGFKANRAVATSPDLGRYRMLHFATHGWIRDRPDLSGVVLSLVDESGRPQDGFLRAFEIYDLDISSDLVVLSACETGLGGEEGGLVRGFLNAGSRQVMATLWRVRDRSTARLMASFYRGRLGQGLSASAALRQAQLDLVNGSRWTSPYYWAGFVLHGDWN